MVWAESYTCSSTGWAGSAHADQQQRQPSQQQLGGYPQKVLRAAQVVDHDGISLELEGGIPLRLILTEPMPIK